MRLVGGGGKGKIDPVDPKLKEAMAEVRAILVKYDIAGCVMLASGERTEYLNHAFQPPNGPTWSALHISDGGDIRFKANPSLNHTERYRFTLTAKMIGSLSGLVRLQNDMWGSMLHFLRANGIVETTGEEAHKPGE